ncbi:MAG: bifunctional adenosylcobinamide kinase/adenosylcobinamide-phosphate guanylyltransferase [Actinomycetota bacterium]
MAKLILMLGGARSGKSTYAEELAAELGDKVVYLATGRNIDDEMLERIEEHRRRRSSNWKTVEVDSDLAATICEYGDEADVILVDCLTLYVSNLLESQPEKTILKSIEDLVENIRDIDSTVIFISNEVGMGIVPPYPLGRIYRDLLGKVNQLIAEASDEVYLLIAGIPWRLKYKKIA